VLRHLLTFLIDQTVLTTVLFSLFFLPPPVAIVMLVVVIALAFLLISNVTAYIPAHATNDTSVVNSTDGSTIVMKYTPGGTYGNMISWQLAKNGSIGYVEVCKIFPYGGSMLTGLSGRAR